MHARSKGYWGPCELPTVSVLVPTFGYADKIARHVRAVLADPAATEVVVAVDGCRDGTLEILEGLRAHDERVVPVFVEHVGKSGALSAALARARGEVCLLLDQDVLAGPGLVTGHARHHRDARHLVVMGYMPTVPEHGVGEVAFVSALYAEEYERHCRRCEADPDMVLRALWGGNVSIRTADCRRVGVDFRYFGHEDQELGLRCLEAGFQGRFDRGLFAQHYHGRDAASFLWYSKMQGASRWQLHRDHAGVLGPFSPDSVLEGMSWAPRALARILGTPAIGEPSAAAAARLGDIGDMMGWSRGQALAYRFARRVALRTGAALAMRGQDAAIQSRPEGRGGSHRAPAPGLPAGSVRGRGVVGSRVT